jgi:hypothetical protein
MAANIRNWSKEGVIEQKGCKRERRSSRWQEWKQVGTKKCPNLAQVRHTTSQKVGFGGRI